MITNCRWRTNPRIVLICAHVTNLPESLSLQLDDCVHDEYAATLLPMAIGYSLLTPDFLTLPTLVECALIRYPDPKPAERDL